MECRSMKPYDSSLAWLISTLVIKRLKISYFQRVATIGFSIYHVKHFLLHIISCRVPCGPIIGGAAALGPDEEILRVIYVFIWTILDSLDDLSSKMSVRPLCLIIPYIPEAQDLEVLHEEYNVYRRSTTRVSFALCYVRINKIPGRRTHPFCPHLRLRNPQGFRPD